MKWGDAVIRGMIPALTGLLLPILHLVVIQRCMKALFASVKKPLPAYIIWAVYYVFQVGSGIVVTIPSYLQIAGNILFVFLLTSVYRYGSIKIRQIFSPLLCISWLLIEVISNILLSLAGLYGVSLQFAASFIAKMCMIIFTAGIGYGVRGRNKGDISPHYFRAVSLLFLISICLIHRIFYITCNQKEYTCFAVILSSLLLLTSCVVFEVYDRMIHDSEVREQKRLYEQELVLSSIWAEERELLYVKMHRSGHDKNRHLSGILGMVRNSNMEGASMYIQKLLTNRIAILQEEVSCSGNITVDTLVNFKCAAAQREEIEFEANIFLPEILPFHRGQLSIIFGNLLDNAIKACRESGTEERYVRLEATYAKEVLFFNVCSPCAEEWCKEYEMISNGKVDTGWQGMGLDSVEHAVCLSHGQLEVLAQGGEFRATVVMYKEDWEK